MVVYRRQRVHVRVQKERNDGVETGVADWQLLITRLPARERARVYEREGVCVCERERERGRT